MDPSSHFSCSILYNTDTTDAASQQWKKIDVSISEMSRKYVTEMEAPLRQVLQSLIHLDSSISYIKPKAAWVHCTSAIESNKQHDVKVALARTVAEEDVATNNMKVLQHFDCELTAHLFTCSLWCSVTQESNRNFWNFLVSLFLESICFVLSLVRSPFSLMFFFFFCITKLLSLLFWWGFSPNNLLTQIFPPNSLSLSPLGSVSNLFLLCHKRHDTCIDLFD